MFKSKWVFPKLVMALALFGVIAIPAQAAGAATSMAPTLGLNVLLIGAPVTSPLDPTTAAWESALTNEGVPYTEVDGVGATTGSWTVTLPALTTSATVGNFDAVVIADSPSYFAAGQLTALDTYEADFGIRQIDGYVYPITTEGDTDISTEVLDSTTATLTAAGLAALPSLEGTISFSAGTNGYPSTASAGFTPWITNSAGVLAGVYSHPMTDAQAGVSELLLNFDYNASSLQWEIMAPSLINWVTQDTHLGIDRNYIEMDIDDTFTPDNAWSIAVHDNDYSDADSLRMSAADVVTSAQWSQANDFRMDQLFNFGGSVEYQDCELDLPGDTCPNGVSSIPDPLLAEFQANDPTTGKPYADDFGWLSHTYDTPYLDVGCATQNYIEAELNENTSAAAAAPGATAGTGGLGLTESTNTALAYGYENPQVFVPGNHSGFADLAPGTPATVDPPDLDSSTAGTGGNLAAGTYEYAVTDQFNGSDPTSTDQSQAYVTAPITVGASGTTALVWQAICHAANYIIYRAPVVSGVVGAWTQVGTYATPSSATLPDNSSGDPVSTTDVTNGGELELTFTDGSTTAAPAGQTYTDIAEPAGWTPPVVEDANELPWEQNPYFIPALEAVGITAVGADASKAYPTDPTDEFGIGATYTGTTYAPGVPFVDGTAEAVPRHPINVFYNASTDNQELDEYNTLYDADYPDSQCHDSSTTTCATTPFTFPQVISSVVSGMFTNMLSNNPEPTYVHQTNIMGTVPYPTTCSTTGGMPPSTYVPSTTAADTTGEGLLYSVLDPLLCQYNTYFNANTPYQQLTMGAIGATLQNQTAWTTALATGKVKATEQNGIINVTNTTGATVSTPITTPAGTTVTGATFGQSYAGAQSGWTSVTASGLSLDATVGVLVDGAVLTANEGITSPNGEFSLVMQGDGNLVEYDGATPAWSSGTNTAGSVVEMQTDGNFVIYSGSVYKWQSGTSGNPGAYLVLGNNGILTVDSASGLPLWGATGIVVPDTTLASNKSITSPNGTYRLTMQSDGNLVEYDGATAAWSSGTNVAGSTVTMQSDGNLVIYSAGVYKWQSGTSGNPGAYLVLEDDGVLSVDSASGTPIWGATGIVVPNSTLASNKSITSPNGTYRLTMQSDGNLVEYDGATAAWSSGTSSAGSTVTMQNDGNLVIYSAGVYKWQSGTSGNPGAYLVLGDNGILTVDSSQGVALWAAVGALVPNNSLTTNESIISPNGAYRLTMQSDGNLVEYNGATVKWASDTATAGSSVIMQDDGNLVIYSSGVEKWQSGTSGNDFAYLDLANSGVLTINSSNGVVLWTS